MPFRLNLRRMMGALRRTRRGGAAVMFALLAVPIIGLTGLAIDVGFMTMAKSRMDLAADASTLAAAKTSATAYAANATNFIAQGQATGLQWFNGQAGTTSGLSIGAPTLVVSQSGTAFTANLSYSGSMSTSIAKFFGFPLFPVAGSSTATITVAAYADIDILMDLSGSMGIAATTAAIQQLGPLAKAYNNSAAQGTNCSFGCHWDPNNNDFYGLARRNNIPLRIDVLISAVQAVLTQLITQNVHNTYRAGLYSFDSAFHTIYAVNTNLSSALSAAQTVTVPLCCGGNNNQSLEPNTNMPLALTTMATTVGASGTGASAATPQKYVFLVTDGVSDYLTASNSRVLGPLTSSMCTALKNNGVTVLVLYTQYPDLSKTTGPLGPEYNSFMAGNVAPFSTPVGTSTLEANLTACASAPEYYFTATDGADITAAMQRMLQVATSTQARFIR